MQFYIGVINQSEMFPLQLQEKNRFVVTCKIISWICYQLNMCYFIINVIKLMGTESNSIKKKVLYLYLKSLCSPGHSTRQNEHSFFIYMVKEGQHLHRANSVRQIMHRVGPYYHCPHHVIRWLFISLLYRKMKYLHDCVF